MTISPLVSIVIPTHNEEAWIASCIESLLKQTYKNIEIIISDDSTDRTMEIVNHYPVCIIQHGCRLGEGLARTEGTKVARGEIILHGEADAIYPPDYIEKGLKYFKDVEVMSIVCGQIKVLPLLRSLIADYCRVKRYASFQMRIKGKKVIYGCHMVRRTVFEKIGYYNPFYKVGSDADFAFRIKSSGMKTVLAKDMYFYHADPNTLWLFLKRTFKGNLYRREFMKRWNKWPKGFLMIGFLLWNTFITFLPVYLFLSIYYKIFVLIAITVISFDSIVPILFYSEYRIALLSALKMKKYLLAIFMPAFTFLRIRSAAYGTLLAIFFSRKVQDKNYYEW